MIWPRAASDKVPTIFLKQLEARKQLYGYYRNPYTDDPSVQGRNTGIGKGNSRGVANTV